MSLGIRVIFEMVLYLSLFHLYFYTFFKIGIHVVRAALKLTLLLKLASNS